MSKRPTIKEEGQGGEPEKKLCHGLGFDKFGQKQLFFNFHFNVVPDVPFFSKKPCHKTKSNVSQNFTMQNLIDTCKDACNFSGQLPLSGRPGEGDQAPPERAWRRPCSEGGWEKGGF